MTLLLSSCSLFVYPSLAEGFGIPPLEAGVMGRPVLCACTTSMLDFENLGFTMFNPYDIDALKKEMLAKLGGDRDSGIDLDSIKNNILRIYNWTKMAGYFIEILENNENRSN